MVLKQQHDQNGAKAIAEQILASEKRKNPKEQDCENLSKVVWKIIAEFTRSISSTRIG